MRRIFIFLLIVGSACTVYGQSSQVRSVSSLPAMCSPGGGAGGVAADHVDLWNGSVNVPYFCDAPNHWTAVGSGSGGFTNPMTTAGDMIVGGSAGAATRLPVNATTVPKVPVSVNGATTLAPPGVVPRASTCTGNVDTILATDRNGYVTESDASTCTVTLPQAGTAGFTNSFPFVPCDIGAGTSNVTPTISTISYTTGGAYISGATFMPLTAGQCALVFSDNTNYFAIQLAGGGSTLPDLTDTSGVKLISAVPLAFSTNNAVTSGSPTEMFRKFASLFCWSLGFGDAADFCLDSTRGYRAFNSASYAWANSSSDASATIDTTLQRGSAGVVDVGGNGAAATIGDISGTLQTSTVNITDDGNTSGTAQLSFGSKLSSTSAGCETAYAPTSVNTGSATTTTGLNCLPANAIIDGVVYRITTTITTAANFTVGITGTLSKFCSTQSTLTSGTTGLCAAQTGTAGALDTTSAAPIVVTFNATPGAGALRIIVFYHILIAPNS